VGAGVVLYLLYQRHGHDAIDIEMNDNAVQVLLLQNGQSLAGGGDADGIDIRGANGGDHAGSFGVIGAHQQHLFNTLLHRVLDSGKGFGQQIIGDGFFQVGHRAEREATTPVLVAGNNVHGNVACRRIVFQAVQDGPSSHIGQVDVQRNGAGFEFAGQRHGAGSTQRHQGFEPPIVRHIHQNASECYVVLNNQ